MAMVWSFLLSEGLIVSDFFGASNDRFGMLGGFRLWDAEIPLTLGSFSGL